MQIAEASALDDATRQLAAELLITLCEAREKAPGMMRKLPQFIGRFFQILLTFLLDIEVCHPTGPCDRQHCSHRGSPKRGCLQATYVVCLCCHVCVVVHATWHRMLAR